MRHPPSPSFLALVRDQEDTLLRAARLLTGDWQDAEELLRDTLAWALSAWESLGETGTAALLVRQRLVAGFLERELAAREADDSADDEVWTEADDSTAADDRADAADSTAADDWVNDWAAAADRADAADSTAADDWVNDWAAADDRADAADSTAADDWVNDWAAAADRADAGERIAPGDWPAPDDATTPSDWAGAKDRTLSTSPGRVEPDGEQPGGLIPPPRGIVSSLAALDPKDRAIVVSRYYLGLSAREISEALGVDAEQATVRAVRTLAGLRWHR